MMRSTEYIYYTLGLFTDSPKRKCVIYFWYTRMQILLKVGTSNYLASLTSDLLTGHLQRLDCYFSAPISDVQSM